MDLKSSIEQFFNDAREIAKVVAPAMAFIGIIGLGCIYMGSSLPIISSFKRNNPDALNTVTLGLVILIAAGSLTSLVVFS
jgi:hypothetical protein